MSCSLTYNNKARDDHVEKKEQSSSPNLHFVSDVWVWLWTTNVFYDISFAGNSNQIPLSIAYKLIRNTFICFRP